MKKLIIIILLTLPIVVLGQVQTIRFNTGTGGLELPNGRRYMDSIKVLSLILQPRTSVISAANISLSRSVDYSFNGTTATWILPAISTTLVSSDYRITIKNRGSGTLTINSNAGGSDIYDSAAVTTITVAPGGAITLVPDQTYFNRE